MNISIQISSIYNKIGSKVKYNIQENIGYVKQEGLRKKFLHYFRKSLVNHHLSSSFYVRD